MTVLPRGVWAQTADDYFHGGATNYVFGEKEKSKEQIVIGLQHFPTDPKLNGLFALLKKEEEQKQQQQQQQDQQKNDQNKDQKEKQDQNKNSQQNKDEQQKQQSNEQKKQEEKKRQDQAKKSNQKKEEQQNQQNSGQKNDKSDQKSDEQPQQPFAAGQMTPQQAKQLLDAQKGEEMIIPIRPEGKPRDPSKPLKDW